MGKIRVLTDETASQVAAGEVVERPASLVKELAENSLDAGAHRIGVEFTKGGLRAIVVTDDGCGMDREDALMCLERHATSKLRSANDLVDVRTMGFRGEALPSIASVSRFRLVTRPRDGDFGTEVVVNGGRVESVSEAGTPPGTRVEVKDLFFNVPARRKFLRGDETEASHIVQVVQGLALSAWGVAIECRKDDRELLRLPAAKDLEVRVHDLFGPQFLKRLLPIGEFFAHDMRVRGFVARPGEGRRDRLQQYLILNGRPVVSPEVSGALREAYAGQMPQGLQPLAILHVEMPTAAVDCNVHPSKRQVRFSRPEEIRRLIFDAVQGALAASRPQPVAWTPPVATPFRKEEPVLPMVERPPRQPPQPPHMPPHQPPQPQESAPQPPADYRIIGRFGRFYFALEGSEGLVLLDVRAARERIAFEKLLRQMEGGCAPSQRLLMPEILELPAREHAWIVENAAALGEAGFLLEPFGGMTVKIEAVPAATAATPPEELLHEVATALRAAGRLPRGHGLHELLARTITRTSSTWSGGDDAALLLVNALLACDLPYASPNGHPTMIQFSFAELERKFGRG